uniref:Uncharacterized protein n=1 Tax=Solanum tuberosum TaxID=4113 RepID=M1DJ03_SOLTU
MEKSFNPSSTANRKSSYNKNKGKASSSIFIRSDYSDDIIPHASVTSSLAKSELVLDPSMPIPSHLGPNDLLFEPPVIAHIITTTLLPRVGSHSTLTQCDTLFA